jgi:hypothetical protein
MSSCARGLNRLNKCSCCPVHMRRRCCLLLSRIFQVGAASGDALSVRSCIYAGGYTATTTFAFTAVALCCKHILRPCCAELHVVIAAEWDTLTQHELLLQCVHCCSELSDAASSSSSSHQAIASTVNCSELSDAARYGRSCSHLASTIRCSTGAFNSIVAT